MILKSSIPIRTFADWQENKPDFMETDLVAHCGESAEGFYLNTLCAVDVWSGWTECLPVFGNIPMPITPNRAIIRQSTLMEVSYGWRSDCDVGSRQGCGMDRN